MSTFIALTSLRSNRISQREVTATAGMPRLPPGPVADESSSPMVAPLPRLPPLPIASPAWTPISLVRPLLLGLPAASTESSCFMRFSSASISACSSGVSLPAFFRFSRSARRVAALSLSAAAASYSAAASSSPPPRFFLLCFPFSTLLSSSALRASNFCSSAISSGVSSPAACRRLRSAMRSASAADSAWAAASSESVM